MSDLIFVTGASGYLGSHVVDALLADKHNYRLRISARGAKVARIRASIAADPNAKDRVEVVEVPDNNTHNFSKDFEGVTALVHTAASIWTKASREQMVEDAIKGTFNAVTQAYDAGIRRVVYTSTIATMFTEKSSGNMNNDWNPVTKEAALDPSSHPSLAYCFGKTESERKLWEYADARPDLDVTAINPPYLYGPFAKHFPIDLLNTDNLSTSVMVGVLIDPSSKAFPDLQRWIDVRDIATAHALAVSSPGGPDIGRKRLFINNVSDAEPEEIRQLVIRERPALKDRVTKAPSPTEDYKRLLFDEERVQKVLGLKFHTLAETFLDNIDALVAVEKRWLEEGAKPEDIKPWGLREYDPSA